MLVGLILPEQIDQLRIQAQRDVVIDRDGSGQGRGQVRAIKYGQAALAREQMNLSGQGAAAFDGQPDRCSEICFGSRATTLESNGKSGAG